MKETSKSFSKRLSLGHFDKYLKGHGIDIGAGSDPLVINNGSVRSWDLVDGDGTFLDGVADSSFDFVYSSHCLEHLQHPFLALENWSRVLKSGGYLYIVVPDYTLYEKEKWPSKFNKDHKYSFSLSITRQQCRRDNHFNISIDMVPKLASLGVTVLESSIDDDGYNYNLGHVDQTRSGALAQITVIGIKE